MKMTLSSTRFVALLAVFVIGLAISGAIYVRAVGGEIKACVNTSGAVYIIGDGFKKTACAKGEQLLSWSIQGPQGEAGPQGPKGDKGDVGASFHLYDANNQDLGTLIGSQADAVRFDTLHHIQDRVIIVRWAGAAGNKIAGLDIPGATLYFTELGCTGDAFINHAENFPQKLMEEQGGPSYFVPLPESAGERHSKSRKESGICESSVGAWSDTYIVSFVTLPFTLPPAWPLKIQ